jgi:hypothetical protein
MYLVTAYENHNDTVGVVIHSPFVNELKVKFTIDKVLEGIDSMTLDVNMNNPAFQMLKPYNTLIKVENVRNGEVLFDGRVLKPTQQMSEGGLFTLRYECEDKLAYLRDSRQRYAKFQNTTIADFFAYLINFHNQQMPPHKRFKVGNVTVQNNTDNVYRFVGYEDTFAEIKDNLIDRLGGFLVLREESDGTYIDYLAEVGEERTTPIRLRSNLQDFRQDIDPTGLITRVIPLGARIEAEEGETADASMPRIDAKSVNGGRDYFDDPALIDEFGLIEGTIVFDDINDPSFLPLRASQFFQNQRAARISYDVNALNLDLIDMAFESFKIGDRYPFEALDIQETLQVIGIQINSESPQKHRLTIGEKYRTLSQYQAEMNRRTLKIGELESEVTRQQEALQQTKELISGQIGNLQTALENIDTSEIPELQEAIENLLDSVSDLADIVDSINIPGLATENADGLLSAADKRKLNRLTVTVATDLDELRDKLALLNVTQSIDLDQLYQDVEELKNGP